jgi:MFS family permease
VTGINTVIYYAPTIIEFTGVNSASSAILASIGVGIVNVVATIVALRLVDRSGRRALLLVGVTGMVISMFMLGSAFALDETSTGVTIIALGSLMAYVAAFAISLGPIFWLMNSEIYPLRVRSKAAAVGTMANWIANFAISLTFLPLIDLLGRSGVFFLYGAVGVFTIWFVWKLVPETKGKHLEDIEAIFKERAARSA